MIIGVGFQDGHEVSARIPRLPRLATVAARLLTAPRSVARASSNRHGSVVSAIAGRSVGDTVDLPRVDGSTDVQEDPVNGPSGTWSRAGARLRDKVPAQ